ncbi:MAG: FtsQ-type POTRA domain-containing protein [Lachnospiraceae bacterium]|nr:FtsQ-type POTRA domain-containing protein [Lachnospiraceae bacterium]
MKSDYEQFTLKQKVWIVTGIAAAVLVIAVVIVLSGFHVDEVEVNGNHHYTEQEIKDMVLKGNVLDNSLLLNVKYANKSIENIPFIERMDVEVLGPGQIRIMVYEKTLAGCVTYLGKYFYFDREGIVVETSDELTEGVAEITGLHYNAVRLYEPLPVGDESVFAEILNLTQLLEKYELVADKIYFNGEMEVTLYFGNARVLLGDSRSLDEKVMQLSAMIDSIRGKNGELNMTQFNESTTSLTFEPD